MPATPRRARKFGGSAHHQKLMMANLAASLFAAEGIVTTEGKAKALRPIAEKLITKAIKAQDAGPMRIHRIRQIQGYLNDKEMTNKLVNEVASKTSDLAGDGTTTATVLAQAIFREGLKNVTAGANPMAIKRGIDKAVHTIVEELKKISVPTSGKKEIAQVGTISANNDKEIGDLIAEAMEKVGKDGVITVEEAKSMTTSLDVVEGMQFDRGYLSPYFVTDPDRMECVLENPVILIHEKKISSMKDLLPLLEQVARSGRIQSALPLDPLQSIRVFQMISQFPQELAQGSAQVECSSWPLASPKGHDRHSARCRSHADTVRLNGFDPPHIGSKQKSIADSAFEHEFLIQLANARPLQREGCQIARVGNGSSSREGQMLGSR